MNIYPSKESDRIKTGTILKTKCGINLGSGCIMRFPKGTDVVDIEVSRRSLYVMQDEVRYKWKHAIPPRKKDIIDGNIQHREKGGRSPIAR